MKINTIEKIFPGVLFWTLLISPFLISPKYLYTYLLIALGYWTYRTVVLSFFSLIGYLRFKSIVEKDWLVAIRQDKQLGKKTLPNQLITLAHYGESYEVLERSVDSILSQNYPIEQIYLAISIEERKARIDQLYLDNLERIKKKYEAIFKERLFLFIHPDNIAGEVSGAASNRTWAVKSAVKMLNEQSLDINDFIVTSPDADTVLHRQYLAAVTYKWFMADKKNNKFFQPMFYKFDNNYEKVPFFSRIPSAGITMSILSASTFNPRDRATFSCYSLSLKTLVDLSYWDTSISIDDTPFYWKGINRLNGEFSCVAVPSSVSVNAIYNENYLKNFFLQYQQFHRWGWGIIAFPVGLKLFFNSRVNIFTRLRKLWQMIDFFIIVKINFIVIMLAMLLLNQRGDLAPGQAQLVNSILVVNLVLFLPGILTKILLEADFRRNNKNGIKEILTFIVELPLGIISLVVFGFLPYLHAATEMMLNMQHDSKIRWAEKPEK